MDIGKDLTAASSTPIVLAILAEGDSYGYAILKRVRELSGGRLEWTDGMLYPVLHRLERLGHVEARWEVAESGRRRKYYRITPPGRAQLAEERRQWQAVDATLRDLWRTSLLGSAGGAVATAPLPQRSLSDARPRTRRRRSRSRSPTGGATSATGRRSTRSTWRSWRTTCASRSRC